MPTSDLHHVSDIAIEIQRIAPRSVLDLGCGFGLYGALCRQIMDGQHGRCHPAQWHGVLHGVEAWENYRNPCWDCYDSVQPSEIQGASGYGLVLMIDVLEHFEAEAGRRMLRDLVSSNRHVIVSVPNGVMEQGAAFGNPYERHLHTFHHTDEFKYYNFKLIHQSVCTVVSIQGMR